jgi:hypothetical protein
LGDDTELSGKDFIGTGGHYGRKKMAWRGIASLVKLVGGKKSPMRSVQR